jgi:hypothetical protein
MESPVLVVLAAGMGSRFGGPKQITPVGPGGELLLDYGVFDARRAGFRKVVFVLRRDMEQAFRESCGDRIAAAIATEHVYQDPGDIPGPHVLPPGRTKPWGTGHAALAARHAVRGPFAVVNADDWYGANAYASLARYLARRTPGGIGLAGFRLADTLSGHGTVSRGICGVNADGTLASIEEVTGIAAQPGGGITGTGEDGTPRRLTGTEAVSMNCWALGPEVFAPLGRLFHEFLDARIHQPGAEFYLPTALGALARAGEARVDVFASGGSWCGVTHRDDLEAVRARLASLHRDGTYPTPLWSAG